MTDTRISRVRWWSVAFFALVAVGLAAGTFQRPGFWSNYVFDIAGPAGAYILLRGLHRPTQSVLRGYFTPAVAAALVIGFCFLLETGQYFGLYHGHFDPYDLVAYVSGVLPCYVADKRFGGIDSPVAPS